jgi:hypothetical protein
VLSGQARPATREIRRTPSLALWREFFTEDPYLQRLKFPADLFSKLC